MRQNNKNMFINILLFIPLLAVFAYGDSNYLLKIQNHTSDMTLSQEVFKDLNVSLKIKTKARIISRLNEIENEISKIKDEIPVFLTTDKLYKHQKVLLKSYRKVNRKLLTLRNTANTKNIVGLDKALDDAIKSGAILDANFEQNVKEVLISKIDKKTDVIPVEVVKDTATRAEAIKLLRQASFVSDEALIEDIMAHGEKAWIIKQLNTKGDLTDNNDTKYGYLQSLTRYLNKNNSAEYPESLFKDPTKNFPETVEQNRFKIFERSVWWQKALHNEDQVRQRVAYALSQLLVLSKTGSGHIAYRGEAAAHYYDILVEHSFGNYGDLLEKVSMNASMADYLTFLASSKDNNITGTAPDENYARELMQLFSVGLYELNDDGTKVLNENNLPTPVYSQDDVSEMARVFTGWALSANSYAYKYKEDGKKKYNRNIQYYDTRNYAHSFTMPIRSFNDGEYHDFGEKTILGKKISANLSPENDMKRAIEILMNNKNIGPHVCRELINRLVTSNPTPEYMNRVVTAFNTGLFNGKGTGKKGDLKATVEAILTDTEARNEQSSYTFGKVDEYMLLTTHYLSSLNVKPLPATYYQSNLQAKEKSLTFTKMENKYWFTPDAQYYHQVPLNAPSVFNFYSPEYVPNIEGFTDNSLVAPEFETRSSNELISFSNFIGYVLNRDKYLYKYEDPYRPVNLDKNKNVVPFTNMTDWSTKQHLGIGSYAGLYIDTTDIYKRFSMDIDGDDSCEFNQLNKGNGTIISDIGKKAIVNLIDNLDMHFTGGIVPADYKLELQKYLETSSYNNNNRKRQAKNIVRSAIKAIIMSPSYMVLK